MRLTTYKFRLYPKVQQVLRFIEDQRNAGFVKNRMRGDREFTYQQQKICGDYCRLDNQAEVNPSALRSDVLTKVLGSGLYCSVNRGASLGKPYKTGDPKRARPSKKPTKPTKDDTPKVKKAPSLKNNTCDMQQAALPQLKIDRPFLKSTSAGLLQNAVKQTDNAFQRFFQGKSGFPSHKRNARKVGLHYPDSEVKLDIPNSKVYLPGVGWVRFKKSRVMEESWAYSKFQVTCDVDQWYISIVVKTEDPVVIPVNLQDVKTVVGGDKGINKLLSVSGKTQYVNPRFAQVQTRRMEIRQRRINRKKLGSKNRAKAGIRVAKLHRKIRRQRDDYQWKVAKSFVEMADLIAVEDLNIKGMQKRCAPKKDAQGKFIKNSQAAKSGLAKSIADAAWYSLDVKIDQQCRKQGKVFHKVDPKFTSQECNKCHHVSKTNRDREKFLCTECGHIDDADNNAGSNIANKAITELGLDESKVRLVQSELTPKINVRSYQRRGSEPGKSSSKADVVKQVKRRKQWLIPSKRHMKTLKDSQPVALAQAG